MSNEIDVLVRTKEDGTEKAERHMQLLGRTAITTGGHLRSGLGVVGKGAFGLLAVGAGAAAVSLKSMYTEADESRRVGALTAAVIKSTGGAAKVTADQVGGLATAISNKTGVDDEAVQTSQNLLLTFTNIRNETGKGRDVFNQASRAVVDMTAAMNHGQVTQEGLKTSSIQLGKALNDPLKGVTALTKVGVTFSAQQRQQIKNFVDSGQTAKAQGVILKEVAKEFGGAAAASTTPMQKLKVVVGNVAEQMGGYLLPVVDKASNWLATHLPNAVAVTTAWIGPRLSAGIRSSTEWFNRNRQTINNVVHAYVTVQRAVMVSVVWLGTHLPGAIRATTHAFENGIHAAGNFVHACGNVVHAVGNVVHASGNVIHAVDNIAHAFGNVGRAVDGAVSKIQTLLNAASRVSNIPGNIEHSVGGLVGKVGGFLNPFAHGGIVGAASGGMRGGLVKVGERGEEMVRLPYGSHVYPNGAVPQSGQPGAGGPLVLELRVTGNSDDLLVKWLRRNVRLGLV